jgi:signal transduction histidine kinase
MPGAGGPGAASAEAERFILQVFSVVRVAALVQCAFFLAGSWQQLADPWLAVGAMAVVVASSAVVVSVSYRTGGLRSVRLAAVDIAASMTAVVLVSIMIAASADHRMTNPLYPYTAVALAIAGFVPVRMRWAGLAAAIASLVYLSATSAWLGFHPELVGNALTYWAYALASWVLTRWLRRMSELLDAARQEAVDRERELLERERDRERAETWRTLHDNVLQTMEALSRGVPMSDEKVRRKVGREAAQLRAMIHNQLDPAPAHLVAELQSLAVELGDAGLDVQLNLEAASAHPVAAPVVAALVAATREALTNVRKHAGVDRCVVRAVTGPNAVSITIVDHGRGFDPSQSGLRAGIGLSESIAGRMLAVGGEAHVSSRPGAGAVVELTAPAGDGGARGDGEPEPTVATAARPGR